MRRIMRRNGDLWGALGRTTCADAAPQTLKNPGQAWAFGYGAKRIRTADPLHAMQVLYQLSYGPFGSNG